MKNTDFISTPFSRQGSNHPQDKKNKKKNYLYIHTYDEKNNNNKKASPVWNSEDVNFSRFYVRYIGKRWPDSLARSTQQLNETHTAKQSNNNVAPRR